MTLEEAEELIWLYDEIDAWTAEWEEMREEYDEEMLEPEMFPVTNRN